jgi:hypothetical protein
MCKEYCGRETNVITIELDEPILTENGYNIHEVILMDENKRLRELLAEAIHALQGVAEYDTDPEKSWTITKEACRDSLENIAVGLKELGHERE